MKNKVLEIKSIEGIRLKSTMKTLKEKLENSVEIIKDKI